MRKRYAIVGVGSRARLYYEAIAGRYAETAELVAFCDTNQTRMDHANAVLASRYGEAPVATYKANSFGEMIQTEQPTTIIVASIDRTHHRYIVEALRMGCDVITEKPMTIDARHCQEIIDAARGSGGSLRVAFNYRYAPHNTAVRRLIADQVIGKVFSVHFEWLLDTSHGADYFRRWHRDRRNSGGLLVHKSTHHFDLVNYWLGTTPGTVFAMGDLKFYGRANAESRGETVTHYRTSGVGDQSPFAIDLDSSETLRELYLKAEHEDGYLRDLNVFGDGISIEDTMGVMVRYANGAIMTYSLNAYMPWEGFNVAINGEKGRIELQVRENSYVNAAAEIEAEGATGWTSLMVLPMSGKPYRVELDAGEGSHGGGDAVMLDEIFAPADADEHGRAAGYLDGAWSILTGIAANAAIATGRPIEVPGLAQLTL